MGISLRLSTCAFNGERLQKAGVAQELRGHKVMVFVANLAQPCQEVWHPVQERDLVYREGPRPVAQRQLQEPEVLAEPGSAPSLCVSGDSIQQATCNKRPFLWQSTSDRSRFSCAWQEHDPLHLCEPVNHFDSQVANASCWEN